MNRLRSARVALAATLLVLALHNVDAAPPRAASSPEAGFLVKFKAGVSSAHINAQLAAPGLGKSKRFKAPKPEAALERWWHVRPDKSDAGMRALRKLARAGLVERIEPNHRVYAAAVPDDVRFAEQWGLHNIGQAGGVAGADVDAPEAWDFHTGSAEVIVAVVDTGIDWTHPDLAANMWVNPGEIPDNGIDDDRNGYVDDVHGANTDQSWVSALDDVGHGTHLAGIVGALGNNGAGIAGVNWRVRLMSVKALMTSSAGFMSDVIEGMLYASRMGARIAVTGFATNENSDALADAVAALNDAGVLVVAAAGNQSVNNETARSLPAGFGRFPASAAAPNVLAVAATTQSDELAAFSNYGPTSVHLGAPGVGILSTVPTSAPLGGCCVDPSGYRALSGTSTSAAFAAGAAALLLAQNPARTPQQLQRLLWSSSDPLSALAGRVASGGRLNVANALSCVPSAHNMRAMAPADGFKAYPQLATRIVADVAACDSAVANASVTVSFSTGEAPLTLYDDGLHGDGDAADGIYANDWSPAIEGPVTLTVNAALPGREVRRSVSGSVRNLSSYRYEQAAYEWIDTAGGTLHTFTMMSMVSSPVTIPIGFNFNFYGVDRDQLTIGLDGYVTFDAQPFNALFSLQKPMPDWFPPNDVIAAYGDMFDIQSGAVIHSLLEGTAPERRLTITWPDVEHWVTLQGATFQMTLYEGSNDIVFRYQDTTVGNAFSYDHGRDAAIGTEDVDAFEATQYPALVPEGTAIRFFQTPYNYAPVANAGGPYSGIVRQPIAFDGSGSSDRNGDALTYFWRFGDTNTFTGEGTSSASSPTYAYAFKGRYTATLVVSDGVRSDTKSVLVDVPNHAPVASAGGPYSGLSNTFIAFSPTLSDIDGDALTQRWTARNASGLELFMQGPGGSFPPGSWTLTLVANDGTANSAPSSTTLSVENRPPLVSAGADTSFPRGSSAFLHGSAGDPDGSIVSLSWRQVSGQAVMLSDTTGPFLEFFIPKNFKTGNLVFELTATDDFGATASDQVTVTVTNTR
jgi:subtilisin family serine protease